MEGWRYARSNLRRRRRNTFVVRPSTLSPCGSLFGAILICRVVTIVVRRATDEGAVMAIDFATYTLKNAWQMPGRPQSELPVCECPLRQLEKAGILYQ
jgi:hypothetical protein